jgi:hypothetical protein
MAKKMQVTGNARFERIAKLADQGSKHHQLPVGSFLPATTMLFQD